MPGADATSVAPRGGPIVPRVTGRRSAFGTDEHAVRGQVQHPGLRGQAADTPFVGVAAEQDRRGLILRSRTLPQTGNGAHFSNRPWQPRKIGDAATGLSCSRRDKLGFHAANGEQPAATVLGSRAEKIALRGQVMNREWLFQYEPLAVDRQGREVDELQRPVEHDEHEHRQAIAQSERIPDQPPQMVAGGTKAFLRDRPLAGKRGPDGIAPGRHRRVDRRAGPQRGHLNGPSRLGDERDVPIDIEIASRRDERI